MDKDAIYRVIDDLLDNIATDADSHDRRHMRNLFYTAALIAKEKPPTLDLKIMEKSLRELRAGFKAFSPWADERKIAVFGSARSKEESAEYKMAVDCSRDLVSAGFMVVTGAGPGIMEAANRGAGRANSFGVNIMLPFEQRANDYIHDDPKLVNFKYFFTRKVVFVKETDGVILFPGGFGTHDEGFETLTLVQTGKSDPRPIVMVEVPGSTYWRDWDHYVRTCLLDEGLISPADLDLYTIVDTVEDAVQHCVDFYRNFHSIRYIEGKLVVRIQHRPSPQLIAQLNHDFSDIVVSGLIETCEPHRYERDEPDVLSLHRLRMHFDQKHLGRLRKLIDALNESVTEDQAASQPHIKPIHGIIPESSDGNVDVED
jgi:uncharacterized protein (TIGR00730 family)